jgi:hypothetical protein
MKVVINNCSGQFKISILHYQLMINLGYIPSKYNQMMYNKFLKHVGAGWTSCVRVSWNTNAPYVVELKPTPFDCNISRTNKYLIKALEYGLTHGIDFNCEYAELKVITLPKGVKYTIKGRHGKEWVSEVHRTWGDCPD